MVAVNSRRKTSLPVCKFDLINQVNEVIEEIMKYKWLESEKEGTDIGVRRATREWIEKYYDEWFRYNRERFIKDR